MPDDEDEVPSIIIAEFEEGEEIFGTSRSEQQARASLILLFIWQEIRDVEEVPSSKLGDALHMSGIDPENMYNMYNSLGGDADRYFNRTSGNPTVALSRQGERAAIDEIQSIADVE
jgi:hypothetical protein